MNITAISVHRTQRVFALVGLSTVLILGLTSSVEAKTATKPIRRVNKLLVTCGIQIQANGAGAAPNEVVKVRIKEQVANGIDISREVVADAKGNFILNDFCDPKDPHAEVPAMWSFTGATSGRTGKTLVRYKLAKSS